MGNGGDEPDDLERQSNSTVMAQQGTEFSDGNQGQVTIVVSDGGGGGESIVNLSKNVSSPKKGFLSRSDSSDEECR